MLQAGEHAPAFSLSDLEGNVRHLGDLTASGPVLLAFFKISCPTCQFTLPFLNRVSGLRVFGISQNDAEGTRGFIEGFGIDYPVLLDDPESGYKASNAYGLTHVPSLFLVDPGGRIEWASNGFHRGDLEALAARAGSRLFRPGERVPDWRPG